MNCFGHFLKQFSKYFVLGIIVPSYIEIGRVVLDETKKCEKFTNQWTERDRPVG